MDWRNNKWVGLGAACLLVVFVAIIFWYLTSGPPSRLEGAGGMTFLCESTGDTFEIPKAAIEDFEVYKKYMKDTGTAVECKICGDMDAYRAYYCPVCEKWYKYTLDQSFSMMPTCPEGHEIPGENR